MGRFNQFLVALVVTVFPMTILAFRDPPKLRRDRNAEASLQTAGTLQFERWTGASGIFNPPFTVSGKSNFMTPIIVLDVNSDGLPDILLTGDSDGKNLLFVNQGGGKFKEQGERYGFDFVNPTPPTHAVSFDYNGDGLDDLILSYESHLAFYLKEAKGRFVVDHSQSVEPVNQLVSAMNVADLQGDGEPDLILANYLDFERDKKLGVGILGRRFLFLTNNRYNKRGGGRNAILYLANSRFGPKFDHSISNDTYTQTTGISDVNEDGLPDLFFSNDYHYDQLLINKGGGLFVDQTDNYMPLLQHGLSGMNSEFYDYNRDGKIDLFVSNIFEKNFSHGGNVLWENKGGRFENRAIEAGVSDCGYAWGAKFGDLNNDGREDLFVTNGLFHMPAVKNANEARSLWYLKLEMAQVPGFLKKGFEHKGSPQDEFASFQRKCLFLNQGERFANVSQEAGIDDLGDRRVTALVDIDSDGRMDILMRGMAGVEIYKNVSPQGPDQQWIGFQFVSKKGSRINPGLKIAFELSNGQKIVREIYPSHGVNVFGDSRVHVGLGSSQIASDITIEWPGKPVKKRVYSKEQFHLGEYNEVREHD